MTPELSELRHNPKDLKCDVCGKKLETWDDFNSGWTFRVSFNTDSLYCQDCCPELGESK